MAFHSINSESKLIGSILSLQNTHICFFAFALEHTHAPKNIFFNEQAEDPPGRVPLDPPLEEGSIESPGSTGGGFY